MLRAFVLFALILLAGAVVVGPTAAARRRAAPPTPSLSRDERALFNLCNAARAREKLPPLRLNLTLCRVARRHTKNMARHEKMAHVLDGKGVGQRVTEGGYRFSSVRENLAYASSSDPQAPPPRPAEIHARWMASMGHRANLLNSKVTEIGLAMARSPRGTYYYTQVFASPLR